MTTNNFDNAPARLDASPVADELSPASQYANPRELLTDPSLSQDEKLQLLTEWEEDIRLALVAAEEGMNGADDVQLREVLSAKRLLTPDASRPDSPSKS